MAFALSIPALSVYHDPEKAATPRAPEAGCAGEEELAVVQSLRGTRSRRGRRPGADGRRGAAGFVPAIAALDLGTNNCRLLIARPHPGGFRVIDGFSRIVRLGEGVAASGALSEAAMARAIDALSVCAEKIARRQVERGRYVATEACRRAGNGPEFLRRVREATGIALETIPSREEAELTLAGCLPLLDPATPYALTFDVGGGSAEILWVRLSPGADPEIEGWISLPCGVVTMTEHYGSAEFTPGEYSAMVDDIEAMLRPFDEAYGIGAAIARGEVQMLGTAGTVTTIAGINLGLTRYNRAMVDGCWLDFEAVREVSRMLTCASFDERAAHACIGEGRAELVVAGCGVLEAVCRLWPAGRLRVADRGVREGILIALADEYLQEGAQQPAIQ
jgi:exopolyphosphatase/guanosine-5'-triphosphate,3'-diphosphate pyrophosphatase